MARVVDCAKSPFAKLDAPGAGDVKIEGGLLAQRMAVNRANSLPHQYAECERTGRIDNFRIAAGLKKGLISKHLGPDSDVYKWIEALSFEFANRPD